MMIVSKSQGPREYMEDRHCAVSGDGQRLLVIGVLDGHGGHQVAATASRLLPRALLRGWSKCDGQRKLTDCRVAHIRDAFLEVDTVFTGAQRDQSLHSVGSTACLAILDRKDARGATLWVANTGDSRCVLRAGRDVVQMSADHKPGTAAELARIGANPGGYVVNVSGIDRVMGNLSVSRALGDMYMRPYVIPNPGVSSRHVDGSEQYLLLATDGLWDVFDSRQACEFLEDALKESSKPSRSSKPAATGTSRREARSAALRKLVAAARKRGSTDNITVLAYFFEHY